jgi:hypothetical protein
MKKALFVLLMLASQTSFASDFCLGAYINGAEDMGASIKVLCPDSKPQHFKVAAFFDTKKAIAKGEAKMKEALASQGYALVKQFGSFYIFQKTDKLNPNRDMCVAEKTTRQSDGMQSGGYRYRIVCGQQPTVELTGVDQNNSIDSLNAYMTKQGFVLKENFPSPYGDQNGKFSRVLIYQ